MRGPIEYCEHLSKYGYDPRSNRHGDVLAKLVLADLLDSFPELDEAARDGRLVFASNHNLHVADQTVVAQLPPESLKDLAWNIDLVLGPPSAPAQPIYGSPRKTSRRAKEALTEEVTTPILAAGRIREEKPKEIWAVFDAKGVMTKHQNARRNRQRDVTALWAVMHTFIPNVVVGAAIPVNIAYKFRTPTNKQNPVNVHANIQRVVKETLSIFRAVMRASPAGGDRGIEALGSFVIDFDNFEGAAAKLVTAPPAPQAGDRIHYESLVKDLGTALLARFGDRLEGSLAPSRKPDNLQ